MNKNNPEFWSIVGEIELDFYEAVNEGKLVETVASLEKRYKDLYERMHGGTEWESVLDTTGFVIDNYCAHAPKAEARAALALSKRLEEFAGRARQEGGASQPAVTRVRRKSSKPGNGRRPESTGISS